ncbi:MAG: hypothetical protein R3B70_11755 [Polyangiaceae bacterium]
MVDRRGTDRDLHVDRLIGLAGGIVGLIGVCVLVSWIVLHFFIAGADKRDAEALVAPQPRVPEPAPTPTLQRAPAEDMEAYRARSMAVLRSYGPGASWPETARIPIGRAMDLYVEGGLRAAVPAEEAPGGAQGGSPAGPGGGAQGGSPARPGGGGAPGGRNGGGR